MDTKGTKPYYCFNLIKIDRSDVMRGHEKLSLYSWVYMFLSHVLCMYILAYTLEVSLDLT